MPRAEEVLIWAGLEIPSGARLPGDSGIKTKCPTCRKTQTLAEAEFSEAGAESTYTCKNGCQPILVIAPPEERAWPGRGYRLRNFLLRNVADLRFRVIDQKGKPIGGVVLIPASPAALADESDAPN
jgi:hypothetical protein